MASEGSGARCTVYTVGHSNYTLEDFVVLLKRNGIEVLADVRSQPYSQYTPHFNEASLKAALPAHGIQYVFLGKELGGRPHSGDFYDAEGHVLYARLALAPFFLEGLSRLEKTAAAKRVALLCSEEDPADCHRRLLIGRVLGERGCNVVHIRGDGATQTEAELERAEKRRRDGGQLTLFDMQEKPEWKSTQSVSPGNRPVSSSEH